MFDTYIAFDPSLWWNNQKLLIARRNVCVRIRSGTNFVFCEQWGQRRCGIIDLSRMFSQKPPAGLKWYRKNTDEKHSTIYHRQH
jgi:hypothetical protein